MRQSSSDTSGVAALGVAMFVVALGTNISTPLLVIYRDRLDLGPSATQAIFTTYVFGIMATLFVAGPASDRFGRRAVVVPCVAVSAVASVIMIFGRDVFALLLAARVLLGIATGASLSVGSAWLLERHGQGRHERAALMVTLVTFAGFGLGPVLSATIDVVGAATLVTPYVVHTALALATLVFVARVPDQRPRTSDGTWFVRPRVPDEAKAVFVSVVLPAVIWTFAFPSTAFSLFPVLLSDVADNPVLVAAASGSITALSGLAARPLVARFGAQRGLVVALGIGTLGYAIGTAAFFANWWWPVIVAAAFLGAASGTLTASSLTLLGGVSDDATRGSLTSTMYLLAYPGMAMPIVLTALAGPTSIEVPLVGVTVLAATAALVVARTSSQLATPSA